MNDTTKGSIVFILWLWAGLYGVLWGLFITLGMIHALYYWYREINTTAEEE